jgi:cobalt-zinc-cadmium resistance protein CzcA
MLVGSVYEQERRFDLRVVLPPRAPRPDAIGDLVVHAADGRLVPLAELADIREEEGPTQVRREGLRRTVRVEVNLRGRDLVSWVEEAKEALAARADIPSQYEVTWGGQFENFERAQKRLALVVPMALGIIFAMLLGAFGNARYALAVFATLPMALIGGIAGLVMRGMPFSIPAAVGFIALAGVSVLNGVIIATATRDRLVAGAGLERAVVGASAHSLREVLTCATVAALGFTPIALSTGAGAEVQRPLATVVVAGIAFSTALSLFIFPGMLRIALRAPVVLSRDGSVLPAGDTPLPEAELHRADPSV